MGCSLGSLSGSRTLVAVGITTCEIAMVALRIKTSKSNRKIMKSPIEKVNNTKQIYDKTLVKNESHS
jgi:hypothetical protein